LTRVKRVDEREHKHERIVISLPKSLNYPLDRDTVEKLEEVEYQVHGILAKNKWALELIKGEEEATADQGVPATPERAESPETVVSSGSGTQRRRFNSDSTSPDLRRSPSYRELPTLEDEPVDPVDEDLDTTTQESSGSEADDYSPTSSSSSSSTTSGASRAHSCPRIRRGEDIKKFSRRTSLDEHQYHIFVQAV
jgi:hypothetical protein